MQFYLSHFTSRSETATNHQTDWHTLPEEHPPYHPRYTGRIQMAMLTKCLEKSYDFMTINRIWIRKMALDFSHHFKFNTNLIIKVCHIIASEVNTVYCSVFGQWFNITLASTSLPVVHIELLVSKRRNFKENIESSTYYLVLLMAGCLADSNIFGESGICVFLTQNVFNYRWVVWSPF